MLKSTVWQASSSATALVMFRIRNLSIAPSKGSLQIIMQLRKSLQRSNTVKLFCYLISRRITCGTLFAQGFAKTKQTWKPSNQSWGTRTSKRLWMSTPKRLSRKSRNLLKDWLQNWTFFNRWRSALMGRSKWQQNHCGSSKDTTNPLRITSMMSCRVTSEILSIIILSFISR